MEQSIRIGYDPDSSQGEYYLEAYGLESEHLGSRHFKKWEQVVGFLSDNGSEVGIGSWLRQIAQSTDGSISNESAEHLVRQWRIT